MPSDLSSDWISIYSLVARYSHALDTRDYELFKTCFTPDAQVSYANPNMRSGGIVYTSPQEAADGLRRIHAPMDATMHRVSNHNIDISGDKAVGRVYVDLFEVRRENVDAPTLNHLGFYDDEYALVNGEWRIARRAYTGVWSGGNKQLGDYTGVHA
ncbi:nuclear transport factor 2 family protein [Rhodococcus koreensis]